jgi:hypothetical protein
MSRTTALVTAFVFVILGGVVHGLWTDRWVVCKEPGAAAASLSRLPMTIGNWEGQAIDFKSSRSGQRQISGIMRRYANRLDGTTVSILLVCGRPGPVSVHTPDVCYDGAGYDLAAPPVRYLAQTESAMPPAEFWAASFQKQQSAVPTQLRILWSWNATGAWQAPDNPRLAFARLPVLYKLYVIRETTAADEHREEDRCNDFVRRLLIEFKKSIYPDS